MNPSTPPGGQPLNDSDVAALLTWLWVVGMSLLGGLVSFMRKVRAGHARAWNFTEFIGEIATAALVGIITFNLCRWLSYPPPLSAAMVGIASHMGSRALFKLERIFDAKFPTVKEPPSDTN
jgi:hypothetical protein